MQEALRLHPQCREEDNRDGINLGTSVRTTNIEPSHEAFAAGIQDEQSPTLLTRKPKRSNDPKRTN
jgi:hypothetical protein